MQTMFLPAVARGDVEEVRRLLAQNSDKKINETNLRRRTALHLAANQGHYDMVEMLIAHGINLAAVDCGGFNALHVAAELGHDKIMARLLEANSDLANKPTYGGLTCLHLAVIRGHGAIVKQLLAAGLGFFAQQLANIEHALYFAVEYGAVPLVVESVKSSDRDCKQMVSVAVCSGFDSILTQLIAHNPQLAEEAYCIAVKYGRDKVVTRLLDEKPELIDTRDSEGRTALHIAVSRRHEKVYHLLLARKPELLDAEDADNGTALARTAAHCGSTKQAMAYLLAKGARVDETIWWGANNEEAMELLLAHKPELFGSVCPSDGNTVLHRAFGTSKPYDRFFSEEFMTLCWRTQPNALHVVNQPNEQEGPKSPFDVAVECDNKFAMELVQGKLSVEEIVGAFCRFDKTFPRSLLPEGLLRLLNDSEEVVETIYEYLGNTKRKNNGV